MNSVVRWGPEDVCWLDAWWRKLYRVHLKHHDYVLFLFNGQPTYLNKRVICLSKCRNWRKWSSKLTGACSSFSLSPLIAFLFLHLLSFFSSLSFSFDFNGVFGQRGRLKPCKESTKLHTPQIVTLLIREPSSSSLTLSWDLKYSILHTPQIVYMIEGS